MRYSLLSLVVLVTVSCVYSALMSYGLLAFVFLGGTVALALRQLILLGRELGR